MLTKSRQKRKEYINIIMYIPVSAEAALSVGGITVPFVCLEPSDVSPCPISLIQLTPTEKIKAESEH